MGTGANLEALRRRAAQATTAEEALELNTEILAVDRDDGVAMNRLGRAYQDLGYIDEAIDVFARAVAVDRSNTIAQRRLRDLRLGRKRLAHAPPGTARNGVLREPAAALRILDGPWRSACVALLADLLRFARRLDASRTIVRDVPPEDYFYVAGGAHASAGPWRGLMDCYADSRGVEQDVIDRVVAAGGRHRSATGQGLVPDSLRLEVPFDLVGELRPVLLPAMRDHIRVAIVRGPPQHMHLHNQALLDAILSEAAA
jgi:tetratricopeptide (TPR) repeat protein